MREQQMPDLGEGEPLAGQALLERGEGRRRPAVEQREAVVGVHDVDADRMLPPAEVEVDAPRLVHARILRLASRSSRSSGASIAGASSDPYRGHSSKGRSHASSRSFASGSLR